MSGDYKFLEKLLATMEKVKPNMKSAEACLTDEFMQKHTKFQTFKEMVELAIKESGILEQYVKDLQDSIGGE